MHTIHKNGSFKSLFDALFDSYVSNFVGSDVTSSTPAVNISENEDAYTISVAAPGLEKKDFDVTIDKDQLLLKTSKEDVDHEGEYRRREYSYNTFSRRFTLPKNVDKSTVAAAYELGVLSIILTKDKDIDTGIKTIEIE